MFGILHRVYITLLSASFFAALWMGYNGLNRAIVNWKNIEREKKIFRIAYDRWEQKYQSEVNKVDEMAKNSTFETAEDEKFYIFSKWFRLARKCVDDTSEGGPCYQKALEYPYEYNTLSWIKREINDLKFSTTPIYEYDGMSLLYYGILQFLGLISFKNWLVWIVKGRLSR